LSESESAVLTIGVNGLPRTIADDRAEQLRSAPVIPMGSFADAERDVIARALESTNGNKLAAANLLRISRKKLYTIIAK
jgi:DNA-binding NtrC family response regulator